MTDEEERVSLVVGGPTVHSVPTRTMSESLLQLINRSENTLLLTTYSARPHPPVLTALTNARDRGVAVSIVLETLGGAGSALGGDEPAAAFLSVSGLDLWHWPKSLRPTGGARMHAKMAVADDRVLLVGSANLTATGVDHSMEVALLVTGGPAPRRAADYLRGLIASRQLVRLG